VIQTIDGTNVHLHREMLRSFSALRYEIFIKQLGWKIPRCVNGLEEDQFDDDNAIYLIATNSCGDVVGGTRLLDTSRRSLLGEIFPHLVDGPVPADPRIFEVTRFAVAPRHQRADDHVNVCMELLWGLQAFGISAGLTHYVSVSHIALEPLLRRAGYRFRRLGGVIKMDGSRIAALQHDVLVTALEQSHARLSVPSSISYSRFEHLRQTDATRWGLEGGR